MPALDSAVGHRLFVAVGAVYAFWLLSVGLSWNLFKELPYSKVLFSEQGDVLSAKVAADGQWRFPLVRKIDSNYVKCLIHFEDKRFYYHLGIDPLAVIRAIYFNAKSRKIVSGASTITMQTARLALGNPPRTLLNKCYEMIIALGIEAVYTKAQILKWYARIAPYGGNVVGLETAVWRYFPDEQARQLTLGQAAFLAVLPNQPGKLHPARNSEQLLQKRNALIRKLAASKKISPEESDMALLENMSEEPFQAPRLATHALEYLVKIYPKFIHFHSSIDIALQKRVVELAQEYGFRFRQSEIHNLAVLVVDNRSAKVKAYVGNNPSQQIPINSASVDNVHAARSSGSVLKPILYAHMLDRGLIGPSSLLPDVPTWIKGYRPENFSLAYSGAVAVDEVIQRSLNVPSVKMLMDCGVDSFLTILKKLGFRHLFRTADEYGLSLILGGAEVCLWDLAQCYSNVAHCLASVYPSDRRRPEKFMRRISLLQWDSLPKDIPAPLSPVAMYHTTKAMQHTKGSENARDQYFGHNPQRIAWKTGTSFGYKDAWSVGYTQAFTVAVWIGNSTGLGRPGLLGLHTAAPLMFEIFNLLPSAEEWKFPFDYGHSQIMCKQSGYYFTPNCTDSLVVKLPKGATSVPNCPYHKKIFTTPDGKYRTYRSCHPAPIENNWFVLPPAMAYYYSAHNRSYKTLPPIDPACSDQEKMMRQALSFIYPSTGSSLFIPIDLDLVKNECYFKAVHRESDKIIHWFMDEKYLGSTNGNPHQMKIQASVGSHRFLITDDDGQSDFCEVEFLTKKF